MKLKLVCMVEIIKLILLKSGIVIIVISWGIVLVFFNWNLFYWLRFESFLRECIVFWLFDK